MATSALKSKLFVSRSPVSAIGAPSSMIEVGDVSSLGEIVCRAVFEDIHVDQLAWPLRRITGQALTSVEITVVRDPFDAGQCHLKQIAGTDEPFDFEARLDDGAGSKWAFQAFVTGYRTRFPKADADTSEVVSIAFEFDAIGPVVETNEH